MDDPFAWFAPLPTLGFYWSRPAPPWPRLQPGEFAALKKAWTDAHPPWYDPRHDLEMTS